MIIRLLNTSTFEEDQSYAIMAASLGHLEALDTILQQKPLSSSAEEEETGNSLLHVSARYLSTYIVS